jgi:hypothetical protein
MCGARRSDERTVARIYCRLLEVALEFEMLIASLTFAAATILVTAFVAIAVVTNRNTRRFR